MDGEIIDHEALRREIRGKYRDVAVDPERSFDFCTGRPLAQRLGYPHSIVDALPGRAVESFAGVSNPFSLRHLKRGEKVVDVGSGAGFDAFVAARQVGDQGHVIGIDMTPEMVAKSRACADALGLKQVEFREGLAEALPIEDGWADVVISNGAINLCAGQKDGARGDPPRAATRRSAAIRRRRQRAPGAARGSARYRSVGRLNRGRAAPCGLAEDARRLRLHQRDHRAAG
ncbi:MAG: methyltransferase domain-containing protein [Solirubrobacteraceae bacterium]